MDLKTSANRKPLWSSSVSHPNVMCSQTIRSNELTTLKVDAATLTDDVDIAETMNSNFSTVYTTEDHANFPEYDNIVDLKLSNVDFNTNEVCRVLKNSNPNKSPGPDTLSLHRAPVAQLVEYRAVMQEVVSLTPARPSLRVLK